MSEQLITIGQIDASDTLGTTLHHASLNGNKRALKKVLDKGIDVDYPNDEGQSPLFCASFTGKETAVEYLLKAGANPNEKSNLGLTPVHAACYSGNVKCLMQLLRQGGDLRLHDYQGRGVKDWAMLHAVPKKRMKVLEFLDKTRLFAMSNSGQDLLLKRASSHTLHRAQNRRNSITNIIRERIGKPSVHENLENIALSHHSLGFGQVYSNGRDKTGFLSAIPLISENNLRHDPEGETYNNGAFCVMESMWWEYTHITVKRLHRDVDPFQGGVVDLLINEIEQIGKLRHPNILTLMGVCQTSNLDGLILIYERIEEGSLYNYLHQRMERLPNQIIKDVALQMCNAIIFIHLRGLVHCAITSHAISVVNGRTFKLGNFEYMVESSKCELGKKNAISTNTEENSVYNWMAPEIMFNLPPSFYCDMYSYCAVLWEVFHGEVPFDSQCSESIKSQYHKGNGLKAYHGQMADFYKTVLDYGLQHDPNNRKLSFLHVRDLITTSPRDVNQYIRSHFQHLQQQNDNAATIQRPVSWRHLSNQAAFPQRLSSPKHETTSSLVNKTKYNNQEPKENDTSSEIETQKWSETRKWSPLKQKENTQKEIVDRKNQMKKESKKRREEKERRKYRQISRGKSDQQDDTRNRRNQHMVGVGATPQKPPRGVQYHTNGLYWETYPESENEDYRYTVSVKKDQSPQKQVDTMIYPQLNKTETGPAQKQSESSTDDTSQLAKGSSLERKTSSMGRFSFLNLQNHQRTRSAGAKPACHRQSELVPEEYSTVGKLTTAGSLYCLYNDHSPDLPLGQREQRFNQHEVHTLPRTRHPSAPPMSADPAWFGGKGSVRDLAKAFQDQIQAHGYYQDVVSGKFNSNCSSVNRQDCAKQLSSEGTGTPKLPRYSMLQQNNTSEVDSFFGDTCSLTTVSVQSDLGQDSMDPYRIAYDVTDDSSSSFTTDANSGETVDSSTESDLVSKWVDHELRKIGRRLSKEIVLKQSQEEIGSPDLFEKQDSPKVVPSARDSEQPSSSQNTYLAHEAGDQENYFPVDHIYYDDEIYMQDQLQSVSHSLGARHIDIDTDSDTEEFIKSPVKTSLPMKSILTTSSKDLNSNLETTGQWKTTSNSKISKIPMGRTRRMSKQKSTEGAYANIVTVKSSLDNEGVHSVTHEMKNLKTGGRCTVAKDIVKAKKIITTFKAQSDKT